MTNSLPHELVVHDACLPCPYLPERMARMPLRWPTSALTAEQLDDRLASGDRRSGVYLYHPDCPDCQECESIRIDVEQFEPGRSHRRVMKRAADVVTCSIGEPACCAERVRLFNAHRSARGMATHEGDIDQSGYELFLVETCCRSFELRYEVEGKLVAVALTDRGANSLSAVYCYFDPQYDHLSLGVYSILKQLDLCREWDMQYLYLGYYIADSPHMRYKARYLPHERRINGLWLRFDKSSGCKLPVVPLENVT